MTTKELELWLKARGLRGHTGKHTTGTRRASPPSQGGAGTEGGGGAAPGLEHVP